MPQLIINDSDLTTCSFSDIQVALAFHSKHLLYFAPFWLVWWAADYLYSFMCAPFLVENLEV